MATGFASVCSCGFRSEPQATPIEAVQRYREHEKGHEPGQRTGDIQEVEVKAPKAATADDLPRKGRKGRAPAPAPATDEEVSVW